MTNDLMHFYNLDPDEDIQQSLRLALMFKEEVDEAMRAYMEMLRLSIDPETQSPAEVNTLMQGAINAALLTGIRAYRSWLASQGIDVQSIEEGSGKDIPLDFFRGSSRWLM